MGQVSIDERLQVQNGMGFTKKRDMTKSLVLARVL
jgi:hypothetical protein